jgi:hypothetical protein
MDNKALSWRGGVASIVALVASIGIGGVASATPPSSTAPGDTTTTSTVAPQPANLSASVSLICGSTASTRIVRDFEATTEPGQEPALYLSTPQSGGGALLEPVAVGDQVPANPELVWQIVGEQLGPWPVDAIVDDCAAGGGELAETGGASSNLLMISLALVAAGALLARLVSTSRKRSLTP